ncbi:MAG: SMC-Scp complex subunit ScpB [bacterium]|nr:SMC-Scp complex subunit ScpB [bacterium]
MSKKDGRTVPEELLVPALGAVIFASGEPVQTRELRDAFPELDKDAMARALNQLESLLDQSGTGLRLEQVAGGYQLSTRPELGEWVRRFFRQRNRARLTPAALETLAIVAYRQPVTSPELQSIRGKDPSAALRSLLDKKLIRTMGRKKVVGRPMLYGTSKHFLVHFGLNGLDDLPPIEEFDELIEVFDARQAAVVRSDETESEGEEPAAGEGAAGNEADEATERGADELVAAVPATSGEEEAGGEAAPEGS